MKADLNTNHGDILSRLREEDQTRLDVLFRAADTFRQEYVGDEVHLRALIEISNVCVRQCAYCGLRAGNTGLERFRMNAEEILDCAREAACLGLGTIVLQGAEDYELSAGWIASIIARIKSETPLAVTLSLGERTESELAAWREAGADRYFLRFETSDLELYRRIHPPLPSRPVNRIEMLQALKSLGYETGSGVMIGIPGQSYASLARDILLFRQLDMDMIGVGPWIPHPETPLGSGLLNLECTPGDQVPNSEIMTYKVIALTRLFCPEANIPSTTALATLNPENGYELGLMRGANVIMPNMTPPQYRRNYEIYPKQLLLSNRRSNIESIHARIESIGRIIGKGHGSRTRSGHRNLQLPSPGKGDQQFPPFLKGGGGDLSPHAIYLQFNSPEHALSDTPLMNEGEQHEREQRTD
ncbi:MAG: [FeFe] hydrogenase H-cluster radical SAM maturase HydE [Syntrophobacteraceae bacterium]